MKKLPRILIITPFFEPNIGGVETHLNDLVAELNHHHYFSVVLTYSPLTTPAQYQPRETVGQCQIIRFTWFGQNIFHRLEKFPLFDFIYLTPYLLIRSFFWMLINHRQVDVIHSQGINGAGIGLILSKIFHKTHIVSTHAIYEHISGISQQLSVYIFNHTDNVLCLSQKSLRQLKNWGVSPSRLHLYRYWVDLKSFIPHSSPPPQFTILFVGRLIPKKGIRVFLQAAAKFPRLKFVIAGNGPEETAINRYLKNHNNLKFLGPVQNSSIAQIYRQSSILCIPSQYPEGFGRVVLEALASGLPIIGSNRGSISEAVDHTVSLIINPTAKNLIYAINQLSSDPKLFNQLQSSARQYAEKHYSSRNFHQISRFYVLPDKD